MAIDLGHLEAALQEFTVQEIGEQLFELDQDQYDEKPVPIEIFIKHPYYLGSVLWAKETKLFDYWINTLIEMYPTPLFSPYVEVLLLASRGAGKTTVATVSVLYEIYRLLCLKHPQKYYNLFPGIKIVFSVFSLSLEKSRDVNVDMLVSLVYSSPWFKEKIKTPAGKAHKGLEFVKKIHLMFGSQDTHALGQAVFGGILDEANFQGIRSNQAYRSYTAIYMGMDSRFRQTGGFIPGILWLVSSPNFSSDFIVDRMAEAVSTTMIIKDLPIWIVKAEKLDLCGEYFSVYLGDGTIDPFLIDDSVSEAVLANLDESRILDVPVEYEDPFQKNLLNAIRDQGGQSITSEMSLFKSRQQILDVMVEENKFQSDIISMNFHDVYDTVERHVKNRYFMSPDNWEAWRFLHIDIGLTKDRLGIAAVYAVPKRRFSQLDVGKQSHDVKVFSQYERHYVVDFALAIEAVKGQEISLIKVKDFLFYLKQINYPIKSITFDGYQSRQMMQELALTEFSTGLLSVDTSRDPYLFLYDNIISKRISIVKHDLLFDELVNLKDDGRMIDHPSNSSKDVSDAVAGALYGCFSSGVSTEVDFERFSPDMSRQSLNGHLQDGYRKFKADQFSKGFKRVGYSQW